MRFFRSAPFSGATVIAVSAFAALGRVPPAEHHLPAGRPRVLGAARRALHAADGGDDRDLQPAVRAGSSAARGPRLPLIGAGIALTISAITLTRLTADTSTLSLVDQLPAVRPRVRAGQRADHEHGDGGHAARPGRRGRGRRLDEPAGRLVARRRRDRIGRGLRAGTARSRPGSSRPVTSGWWVIVGCGIAVLTLGLVTTGALGQAHGRPGRRRVRPRRRRRADDTPIEPAA